MNIFIVTPIQRANQRVFYYPQAMASIYALEWQGGTVTHYCPSGGDDGQPDSINRKYNEARDVFLAGKWDYFMCAEADMILPTNALEKLRRLDADIAYGLYVWRKAKHEWSAYRDLTVTSGVSISKTPDLARECWGKVIEVAGVGQGCTLIKRHVIEAQPFRWRQGMITDWLMSIDAQYNNFTQLCDLSVVCGHINGQMVLYPDPTTDGLFRIDTL